MHEKGVLGRDYGPILRTLSQVRKDIWYEGDDPELGGDLDDLVHDHPELVAVAQEGQSASY